jgi:hypothetical protein
MELKEEGHLPFPNIDVCGVIVGPSFIKFTARLHTPPGTCHLYRNCGTLN